MSASKMNAEQFRMLQSELAAEEMKLTIMKQMRQSQQVNRVSGADYGPTASSKSSKSARLDRSVDPDTAHPSTEASSAPPLQLARGSRSAYESMPRRTAASSYGSPPPPSHIPDRDVFRSHSPTPLSSGHHQPYSGSTSAVDFNGDRKHYGVRPPPEVVNLDPEGGDLPPPPPLKQISRSELKAGRDSSNRPVVHRGTSGGDSPPLLLPRSDRDRSPMGRSRHDMLYGHGAPTSSLPPSGRHDAGMHRGTPSSSGRHGHPSPPPPSGATSLRSSHLAAPQYHDYGTGAPYRSKAYGHLANVPAPPPPQAAPVPAVPTAQDYRRSSAVNDAVSRITRLLEEREHYVAAAHLPNMPPQYDWSLVPTLVTPTIMPLVGLDECVRRLEQATMGPSSNVDRYVTSRPVCAHCKVDFAQFWRSFSDDGKTVIVCENCDWLRVKQPFLKQHHNRLRECMKKVDSITVEIAEREKKAGVKVMLSRDAKLAGR